ncbi:hypothetical protein HPB48_009306 [Haemaphysalis longicornis]|uniref:Uncharacterized protein n=1 Tax=Haemaphysalis longicornis TaxID=44386 RepID=A0A9J6FVL1_HAELO|nr:hypothetical protein HPB48_009306 [Haemaphysalis longicornis]
MRTQPGSKWAPRQKPPKRPAPLGRKAGVGGAAVVRLRAQQPGLLLFQEADAQARPSQAPPAGSDCHVARPQGAPPDAEGAEKRPLCARAGAHAQGHHGRCVLGLVGLRPSFFGTARLLEEEEEEEEVDILH